MLYSGESFSRSLRGLFHLPSRPLLSAAVMPMLLSKELSASSDGYSLFFFYSVDPWYENVDAKTKDPASQ